MQEFAKTPQTLERVPFLFSLCVLTLHFPARILPTPTPTTTPMGPSTKSAKFDKAENITFPG